MESPVARLLGAVAMLALFFWVLVVRGPAANRGSAAMPGEVTALLQSSRDFFVQEKFQQALRPTLSLVERYPDQHEYLERLAIIYQRLGRRAEEAAAWEQFMDHSPTPSEACPAVALAYEAAKDTVNEAAAYARCYTLEKPSK